MAVAEYTHLSLHHIIEYHHLEHTHSSEGNGASPFNCTLHLTIVHSVLSCRSLPLMSWYMTQLYLQAMQEIVYNMRLAWMTMIIYYVQWKEDPCRDPPFHWTYAMKCLTYEIMKDVYSVLMYMYMHIYWDCLFVMLSENSTNILPKNVNMLYTGKV